MATGYIPSNKDLRGDRGPALRGPQNWEDVPVGFQFQSGGDGDLYFDAVIYGDNYYSCHKNHTKTANNFPKSTTSESQKLWYLGDKFDIVATKLLLATYALIKNLGVEAVEMKDSEGNVLFQVKDGDVVCKTGSFENVKIEGFLYKKKRVITQKDLSEYVILDALSVLYLDFDKAGTWIEFADLTEDATVYMPPYSVADDQGSLIVNMDSVRRLVGCSVIFFNRSEHTVTVTGGNVQEREDSSPVSVPVPKNYYISLECKASAKNDTEHIYWLYRRGKSNNI